MSTYAVTFRIGSKTVGGKTYDQRRDQLIENVRSDKVGYWEETTSFFFVQSDADTYDFGKFAVKGLSAAEDLVVIFDPEDMSACYFGDITYPDVFLSFLPNAKKLG